MRPLSENRIPSPDNYRKVSKPLIEKKRRARINASLNELKNLLETVLGAEIPRDSKMEKADILELAVKHLRRINTPQINGGLIGEYRSGYGECATETSRYLGHVHGMDTKLRTRIMNHLANSLNNNTQTMTSYATSPNMMTSQSMDNSRLTTPLYVNVSGHYPNKYQPITNRDTNKVLSARDCNGNYVTMPQRTSLSGHSSYGRLMTSQYGGEMKIENKVWRPW